MPINFYGDPLAKFTDAEYNIIQKDYDALSSDEQSKTQENHDASCNKYFETDSYKNGETDTYGYAVCCKVLSKCGTSGWVIFLIILLVLGLLAGGAAAFYFFYWKRKNGGQESNEEDTTEDTKSTIIEVSIDTY